MSKISVNELQFPYLCPFCNGAVDLRRGPGRTRRFHAMAVLPVPLDLAIPACDTCQTEWLGSADAARIDAAMAAVYRLELSARATVFVDRLQAAGLVAEVETVLDLTRGYLSRIRAGRKTPSATLVAELAMIAANPSARLAELQAFWRGAA